MATFTKASVMVGTALAVLLGTTTAQATFPGHNGRIAFYANRGEHPSTNIYSIAISGSGLEKLTEAAGTLAAHEDWSPDGTKIVFEIDPDANGGNAVEIMNADGTGVRDLTGARNACEFEPSFTPDGNRIVFMHFRGQCGNKRNERRTQIWSMNLHGKDRHKISGVPGVAALDPNVSPEGKRISFVVERSQDLQGGALFIVNMNGNDLHRIVPYGRDVGIKHDWSPDGSRIVFTEYLDYNQEGALSGPHTPNVATVEPDGSDLVELTHRTGTNAEAIAGSYSPDGRWIVFRFDDYDRFRLMKMRPDGTDKTLIRRMRLKQRGMDWGPKPS
jgi:Tol biopolymer transport system component